MEVYLARLQEGSASRAVLVRRVPPHLAKNKPTVARFLDEARLAGLLPHPGIVQVLESGEDAGTYFIALEHVFGEDLGAVLAAETKRGGRLPVPVALRLTAGLLEALGAAHDANDAEGRPLHLVHRDVRPENVLLGFDGAVKLTGLSAADHDQRTENTTFGVLRGKLAYLSPEALSGRAEARSDLYAVGTVLYELLTGSKAFERQSEFHTMKAIREESPAPASSLRPELRAPVDALLAKALAKKPEERYPDARAMLAAVEKLASSAGGLATPTELAEYATRLFSDRLRDRRSAVVSGQVDLGTILAVTEGTPVGPPEAEPAPHGGASQPEPRPEPRSRGRMRAAEKEAPAPERPKSRPPSSSASPPEPRAPPGGASQPELFSEAPGLAGATEPSKLPRPVLNLSPEPPSEVSAPAAPPPPARVARPAEVSETTAPESARPARPESQRAASVPAPARPPVSEVSEISEPSEPRPLPTAPPPSPALPVSRASARLPHAPIPVQKKPRFRLRKDAPLHPLLHVLIPFLGLLAGAATVRAQRAAPSTVLAPLAPVAAVLPDEAPLDTDLKISDEPAEPPPNLAPQPLPRPGRPEESLAQSVTPRDKPSGPRQGTLRLEANPPSAVSVDGKPAGQTPLSLRLPAGRHQVMVIGPQGITKRFQVDVLAGKLAKKVVTFPYTPPQPKVTNWP